MAGDSDITAVLAVRNDIVLFTAAGINADDTGDAYLDVSTMEGSKIIFLVQRDTGATHNPTLVVKDGGAFSAGDVGNITQLTTLGGEYIAGPFETARVKDSDGYIRFSKSTADTIVLTVRAILLP